MKFFLSQVFSLSLTAGAFMIIQSNRQIKYLRPNLLSMVMSPMRSVFLLLFVTSLSNAQDTTTTITPSSTPTAGAKISPSPTGNTEATISIKPSNVPFFTSSPTISPCTNNPIWRYTVMDYSQCTPIEVTLTCDHDLISCGDLGNIGLARYNCCKCNPDCDGQCNEPIGFPAAPCDVGSAGGRYPDDDDDAGYDEPNDTVVAIGFLLVGMVCCGLALCGNNSQPQRSTRRNRRATLQTMTARRRQQRENNTTSQELTEEERQHAHYEVFVTKFLFQKVLPDKSNVTANSLRSSASTKLDEEHPPHTAEIADDASDVTKLAIGSKQGTLSSRLASWRRPSAKDECCICLECYSVGETICVPITTECNHVFHFGCINEWLKENDKCPLCRIELLKDSTT